MKVKLKVKYLAKIKKPDEVVELIEKALETSPSYQIQYCENIKIKLFQSVESFDY